MNFVDQGIPNAKNLKREGKWLGSEPLAVVSRRRSDAWVSSEKTKQEEGEENERQYVVYCVLRTSMGLIPRVYVDIPRSFSL